MQQFIDIIIGIVQSFGYLTTGYVFRGDPNAEDFTIADFTKDGAWHEWDLSGIVPAGAKAVNMRYHVRATAVNKKVKARRKGQAFIYNVSEVSTIVANSRHQSHFTFAVDSDRKAEYYIEDATFNVLFFTVCGWWL